MPVTLHLASILAVIATTAAALAHELGMLGDALAGWGVR